MSFSRMSRPLNATPLHPREGTLEEDLPTQGHPLRFSWDTPYVQVPREDLVVLKDLMLELNQVAQRQELLLTRIEKKVTPCQHSQEGAPSMPSLVAPAPDDQVREVQSPDIQWSPMRQCSTRHVSSPKERSGPSSPWSRRLHNSESPAGKMETPRTNHSVGGTHS